MKKILILIGVMLLSLTMFSQQPITRYFDSVDKYDTYGLISTDYVTYKIEVDVYSQSLDITNYRGEANFYILDETIERGVYEGNEYMSAQMRNKNTLEIVNIYLIGGSIILSERGYNYIFYNQN